jgi:hypothetical protein
MLKLASGEPGLLFRGGNPINKNHDYEPSWDYEVDEEPPPNLARMATEVSKHFFQELKSKKIIDNWMMGFEVWAANLQDTGAVAMYISGTHDWPVVLIDLRQHIGYEDQIGKSLHHELIHAVQEAKEEEFNEDEAEDDLAI